MSLEERRTSFGASAGDYDAVRPPWPEDVVAWMLGEQQRALNVLDLGAGTGIATRTIAGLGHRVVALDPSSQMLAVLTAARREMSPELAARVETRVGRAERLLDEAGTYDVVTCFQAWHWVEPRLAGQECARVLVAGGLLSLAWHSWAGGVDWLHELGVLVGTPEMIWDAATLGAATAPGTLPGFEAPEHERFCVEQRLSPSDLARLASTWSAVAVRPDRDDVLDAVRGLGERVAGADGTLVFPSVTDCWRSRRA